MKIALRIEVGTWRGLQRGVPALLNLLRRNQAGASFLFSLGPDRSGRTLGRGTGTQVSSLQRHGALAMCYGTLLPAPDLGRQGAERMREVRDAGFEPGLLSWDRVDWQKHAATATANWTEASLSRAFERFGQVFGEPPLLHGAAGWQMNPHALRLEQRGGLLYASDTRGAHPFMPVWNGEVVLCPQLPTTLPTLDELIGHDETTADNVHERLLALTATPSHGCHVFTLFAELEGIIWTGALERLLSGWREQGHSIVALRDLMSGFDSARMPRHEITHAAVPGRADMLALQGEEFLAQWKEAR